MPSLAESLLDNHRREELVARCAVLVEQQVDCQPTLRRLALKAGIAVLNTIRPGAVHLVVADLLPGFTRALDPLYQAFLRSGGQDFSDFLSRHQDEAARALIQVTDERAAHFGNPLVIKVYTSLRPRAEDEVRSALPQLAPILADHIHAPAPA